MSERPAGYDFKKMWDRTRTDQKLYLNLNVLLHTMSHEE